MDLTIEYDDEPLTPMYLPLEADYIKVYLYHGCHLCTTSRINMNAHPSQKYFQKTHYKVTHAMIADRHGNRPRMPDRDGCCIFVENRDEAQEVHLTCWLCLFHCKQEDKEEFGDHLMKKHNFRNQE